MKRICVCCGEAMTKVGLNPNTCLDCESLLEDDSPQGIPGPVEHTSNHASQPVSEKARNEMANEPNLSPMIDVKSKTHCWH
jgi:hypothetical protein